MTPKSLIISESEIEDPKFSPDGKWISFVRDSNLWVIDISTGQAKALTTGGSEEILKGKLDWVYPEELDSRTAYWWSPDSSKLAYYEMDERPVTRYPIMDMSSPLGSTEYTRYPQAGEPNPIVRVGVVAVTGGETKWMDTGTNTDVYLARVNWLHDSQRVAIQRLNRAQNQLDLLFCDATSGASQNILTEKDKYWINISDDLYFFADNKRFLWSSERTAFRHFYLYDLSGKELDQVTSGDWEVGGLSGFGPRSTQPGVDEEHGYIYFRSNKDDVLESQLYRLSLRDKKITQITHGAGSHAAELSPDHMEFVDTYSSSMTPPRQDLYRTDGSLVVAINENKVPELAEYHLSPVEFSEVSVEDGTKLHISIIKPANFDPSQKYPVLISVYGGPHVQVVRNAWGGGIFLWHEIMAQKGYIIFSLDNRGSFHLRLGPVHGSTGSLRLEPPVVGIVPPPHKVGTGSTPPTEAFFAFGDAGLYGSISGARASSGWLGAPELAQRSHRRNGLFGGRRRVSWWHRWWRLRLRRRQVRGELPRYRWVFGSGGGSHARRHWERVPYLVTRSGPSTPSATLPTTAGPDHRVFR